MNELYNLLPDVPVIYLEKTLSPDYEDLYSPCCT